MSTPIPPETHDGSGPVVWGLEVVCVLGAVALILTHLARFAGVPEVLAWSTVAAVLLAWPAADFVSGLVHWLADTWGDENWPVLGRRFLRPFRTHHVSPEAMLRCGFFDTNGDVALVTLPFLLAAFAIPLETALGRLGAAFLVAFCTWGLPTNQIHQWAHVPSPPSWVAWLQRCRLILNPQHHRRHHAAPFATHYCIVNGWCNGALAAVGFFPALERLVTALTGVTPRADDVRHQSAPVSDASLRRR